MTRGMISKKSIAQRAGWSYSVANRFFAMEKEKRISVKALEDLLEAYREAINEQEMFYQELKDFYYARNQESNTSHNS